MTALHPNTHSSRRLRAALGWCGELLSWLIILGITAIIAVSVIIPRMFGATPYVILTGSMQPEMAPGTLVVAKPVDPEDLGTGTVVTYQLTSGDPTVVTHRVTQVGISTTGEYRFTTQGDANNVPDAKPVQPVQIMGERWYYVPYLGYITNAVGDSQRQAFTVLAVFGLFGYAGWMFVSAALDRRKDSSAAAQEAATT